MYMYAFGIKINAKIIRQSLSAIFLCSKKPHSPTHYTVPVLHNSPLQLAIHNIIVRSYKSTACICQINSYSEGNLDLLYTIDFASIILRKIGPGASEHSELCWERYGK